jgi:hypothetical protein
MARSFAAVFFSFIIFLSSCTSSRESYSPLKKYDKHSLQTDYLLLKDILEHKHPSIYWYTSKDSMDMYFTKYYNAIRDSMTEQGFAWQILAPLVDKIKCGHTSISMSKSYSKWADNKIFPSFPLYMKIWNDTMLTMINLNKKDSSIKKGTIITSINGVSDHDLIQKMFDYLPQDGNANSINYIRLSANFPYYHRNIFGLSKTYNITYLDSSGNTKNAAIALYEPIKDSAGKEKIKTKKVIIPKLPKEKKILVHRSLKIDSSGKFAIMTVNTFANGKLKRFFRKSFRQLNKKNINELVLDIRLNGGGRVGLSTLLARYVSRKPFKVADSLYAVSRSLGPYTKYVKGKFFNNLELFFITRKRKDGFYHIGYLEKKKYKPKNNNHYNGNLYVLTSGPTFSAASLFCNMIRGQDGIKLVGEETGGGWYGNNGIMIPDITLPNTRLRVRLPLFRLVQYQHIAEKGRGVVPDIFVGTSYDALMKGYDKKMKVVKDMITGPGN